MDVESKKEGTEASILKKCLSASDERYSVP
jgi:hypothetical protein